MNFGVELLPNRSVDELVELACREEEAGFDRVWVADHFNNRNIYCVLTAIAVETSVVELGPGVTNPYVVHPAITASAVSTVDEVSSGRAILGLGAGDRTTLNRLGLDWDRPVTRTEEAINVIRRLVGGERLSHDCDFFELDNAKLDVGVREIPVYVGGQGPKMLEMAGRVGDGVLINASHPRDISFGVKRVQKGRRDSVVDGEIDIAAHTCFSIDRDREEAVRAVKPVVAFVAATAPEHVLERHEISLGLRDRVREHLKENDFNGAKELVSSRMVDAFSVTGTPSECRERIERLIDVGVDSIVIGSPYGPSTNRSLNLLEEIIQEYKD